MRLRYSIGGMSERCDWLDPLSPRFEEYAIIDLVRDLNRESVVAFLGSGVTAAYGRPTWSVLTEAVQAFILKHIKEAGGGLGYDNYIKYLESNAIDNLDRAATLLARLQVCEQALRDLSANKSTLRKIWRDLGAEDIDTNRSITISDIVSHKLVDLTKRPFQQFVWRDPIRVLIEDLGIRRFLTTNYDNEVENWFSNNAYRIERLQHRHVDSLDTWSYPNIASFGLNEGAAESLIKFAVSMIDAPRSVFHLHGSVDSSSPEPPYLIVTEGDYQRHYHGSDRRARLFREAVDLALTANTILFIGMGMSEEDINRPLRQFMADRPRRLDRSIFALLEPPTPQIGSSEIAERWSEDRWARWMEEVGQLKVRYRQFFLERYGVRVIFLPENINYPNGRIPTALVEENNGHRKFAILERLLSEWPSASALAENFDYASVRDRFRTHARKLVQIGYPDCRDRSNIRGTNKRIGAVNLLMEEINNVQSRENAERLYSALRIERMVAMLRKSPDAHINGLWQSRHRWFERWQTIPARRTARFLALEEEASYRGRREPRKRWSDGVTRHLVARESRALLPRMLREQCRDLRDKLGRLPSRRIALVVGERGAGRGSLAQWLLTRGCEAALMHRAMGAIDVNGVRRFVGTTHVSSEFMSVVEGCIDFLEQVAAGAAVPPPGTSSLGPRWRRLRCAIDTIAARQNAPGAMIILGGIERLVSSQGTPVISELKYFFSLLVEAAARCENISVVLLCNRDWWNRDLARQIAYTWQSIGIVELRIVPCSTILTDYRRRYRKFQLNTNEESALDAIARICHHHRFAILTILRALRWLRAHSADDRSDGSLLLGAYSRLSRADATHSAEVIVEVIFDRIHHVLRRNARNELGGAADRVDRVVSQTLWSVLHYLALRGSPMSTTTLEHLVKNSIDGEDRDFASDRLRVILADLTEIGLIYRFVPRRREMRLEEPAAWFKWNRYCLHSTVRKFVLRKLQQEPWPFADPGYFELSSYESSGVGSPAPSPTLIHAVRVAADSLLDKKLKLLDPRAPGAEQALAKAESKLRTALHLFRASLPFVQLLRTEGLSVAATQLGDEIGILDIHRNYLVRIICGILNCSRKYAEGELPSQTVYADEALWLYNEVAAICLAQGDVADAKAIFGQSLRIYAKAHGDDEGDHRLQLQLQVAMCNLELGHVDRARKALAIHLRAVEGLESVLAARVRAYAGIGDMLAGEPEKARQLLLSTIRYCEENGRMRGLSIFRRFLGDMARDEGDYEAARKYYNGSISAASTFADLRHYARIHLARLHIKTDDGVTRVVHWLDDAVTYARQSGLPRMEAEAARARAEVRLLHGEYDAAAEMAREALAITSSRRLRLRTVSGLTLLGRILIERGDEAGRSLLLACKHRAQRMPFAIKVREAEQALGDASGDMAR